MGNDADKAVSVREIGERFHRLLQGFFVEGAEALVYEHRIQADTAGGGLDLIGQSKRQRK